MKKNVKNAGKNARLQDLMLAIAERHKDDQTFGKTRMFKEAFWVDALHYGMTGETLTGCEYIRMPRGPVPDCGMNAFDQLVKKNRAELRQIPTPSGMRQKVVPIDQPKTAFTKSQLDLIEYVTQSLDGRTAKQVSDHSHDVGPWKFAEPGKPVNLNIIFIDFNRRPSERERQEALAGMLKAGIQVAVQDQAV